MKDYLKLLRFLRGHGGLFAAAFVLMLLSALFEGVQFSMMVPLVDRIFTKQPITLPNPDLVPGFIVNLVETLNSIPPEELLTMLVIAFFSLLLIKHAVVFWYGFLMNDISQRIMRDIRFRLYETIQHLSLDYFSRKRSGELISRITHDVQVVENAVSYGVTDLFRQSFTIVMFMTIAFTIHYKATLILFVLFPLIGWPMSRIGKKLKKLSKSSQEKMADINSLLLETISGIKVVKAFCMEDHEIKRFWQQNRDFYKLKMKSIRRMLFISPITEIIGGLFGVLIIFWLGRQVMADVLSFGVFVLFFGSIMSIISPIKKLGNVNALTQQALAANTRIYEVLETPPSVVEKPGAKNLPPIKNCITFESVSFHYEQESGDILKDINLEIKVGEMVAIVGPTGTGKSTLANLIPRFYDPTSGTVKIDGTDLREVTFKSLRGQTGNVTQETILFNDTVRNNIAYGHPEATQEEIEAAALKAFAHRFIVKMPKGYDTVLGDRGFRLSGGEKQRIAIARAILKNPPILILDEATSQLDSESEKIVQEALDRLMQGRTVIAIAHRLSTIKKATKIVVLEHGRIVGLDRHEKLLETCPLYKRLHETQFQL